MTTPPPRRHDHIVDVLIAERAPRLRASPLWPGIRPALYGLLGYRHARAMADAIAVMGGREAMDYASDLLRLTTCVVGREQIPTTGRLVVVCNHPTGLADGLPVYDVLKPVRPEMLFFANSDAHRINPRLSEIFIPVEWVAAKRTRERTRLTLKRTQEAFEADGCVVIFPAGRIARRTATGRLVDPPWESSAIALARRHKAPVLPMHLTGPASVMFNLFDGVSQELRDITLFHELLNKRGKTFDLAIGPLIAPEALEGDADTVTERLKTYVETVLPVHPDQPFA